MDEQSNQIKVGSVGDKFWHLNFQIVLEPESNWCLDVFAHDPSNMRKSGILARLNKHNYQLLKELIQKTDENIIRLENNKKQNQQKLMEQLRSLSVDQLSSVGISPEWLN